MKIDRKKSRKKRLRENPGKLWIAVLLSIAIHVAFLLLLPVFSNKKPDPELINREKYHIVQLFRPSDVKNTNTPDTHRRSVENSNAPEETVNREKKNQKVIKSKPFRKAKRPVRRYKKKTEPAVPKVAVPPEPEKIKAGETVVSNKKPPAVDHRSKKVNKPTESVKKASPGIEKVKLFPTESEYENILGIDNSDHVPDVKSGKKNVLKAKKWLGTSFFLRLREAVAQVWDPNTVYRKNDPDGSVYGFKNWFTVLRVTLDSKGNILKLIIVKQSGLKFLDVEALRAFRGAAPFLNPPPEIINPKTGNITFSFGFYVEVNTKIDFKLFKF
ncbi:MAG: TonB family protein [Deltaproteobacteria bacterium]|nr:TonB family protein [Deltaproteobacteria bacterium]